MWHYLDEPFTETPEEYAGFVYLISDLNNDMLYVGKKLFWTTTKLKPLKGKKNKRHRRAASDWQDYYGSSERLTEMVNAFGKEEFYREILHLCENKNTLSYLEAKEQFDRDVLLDDRYYNGIINCRVNSRGLKYVG